MASSSAAICVGLHALGWECRLPMSAGGDAVETLLNLACCWAWNACRRASSRASRTASACFLIALASLFSLTWHAKGDVCDTAANWSCSSAYISAWALGTCSSRSLRNLWRRTCDCCRCSVLGLALSSASPSMNMAGGLHTAPVVPGCPPSLLETLEGASRGVWWASGWYVGTALASSLSGWRAATPQEGHGCSPAIASVAAPSRPCTGKDTQPCTAMQDYFHMYLGRPPLAKGSHGICPCQAGDVPLATARR